ncbi:hypothetical protein PENSPDRAFT_723983, partial [Peniophora sp. CONT]
MRISDAAPRRSNRAPQPAQHRNADYQRVASGSQQQTKAQKDAEVAARQEERAKRRAELEAAQHDRREARQDHLDEIRVENLDREIQRLERELPDANDADDETPEAVLLAHIEDDIYEALLATGVRNPATWQDAMDGPDAEYWREGIGGEIGSLQANKVYEIVPIPDGVKPISSKVVLKVKVDEQGRIVRYMVRIIA